jgi:hypothetical protein
VDTNGNVIKGRYVDLIPKRGEWTGKEITSGKDLIGVERREKTDELVTALVCLGPEGEDGDRLTVEVKDDEALERWGRGKDHLWDVYEPQSTDEEMTTSRLRTLGRAELEKRVNAIVEYETDQASIESVFGLSHEKVRFRDTVRIKDTSYRPPLYIEAQVKEVRRSISDPSQKIFVLGDFIEFEEEDLRALFNSMREHLSQRIALKVGQDQLADYTYDKDMIDLKDIPGVEAKDKLDTDVGDLTIEDTSGSQLKADSAREAAKSYTDANAFLKERQYTNGLYWDENEGLVVGRSDGLVRTVQNATEGIVIQRRTSTSDAWENVIYADHNGDIKFKGSLEGADGIFKGNLVVGSTTIDGNGILTEEGDLKVKDDVTQIVTSTRVLDNMVNDHSFELVPLGNGAWNYATRRVAIDRMQNYFNWMIEGDRAYARVQSTLASDDYQRAKYGYQAAILEQRYYWTQYLRLDIDRKNVGPYTISAYFSAFESTSEPTVCRVLVHAYDFDLNLTQQNSVGNFTVTVYPDEIYKWKRGYATFENLPSNTSYLKIRIDQITGNSTRTLCDGVQMVPLEHPTQYQPEDSLFKYIQGVIGY